MRKPIKAYKNSRFMLGDDARSLRILAEYLEPEARLQRKKIHNAVIVFGSARTQPKPKSGPDYYRLAAELAEKLARWTVDEHPKAQRYYVCTGGGPGIMQAVHEGVAKVDRHLNIGLNISLPFEQHLNPHVELDHAFEFHYFFMRKFWFMNLARGAVIFPGGFGTLDELFELLTLTQTGKSSPMPIVLFGRKFWERTIDFKGLARMGLISRADLKLFHLCEGVEDAFEFLTENLKSRPVI